MSDDRPDKYAWERPGTFAVAPGVYRIPLPLPNDGLHAVNVYALVESGRVTMIDAGWTLEESRRRLEESLAQIGHDLGDIDRFLVTHGHRDHYTQAVAVRRELGTRVLLGAEEAHSLASIADDRGSCSRGSRCRSCAGTGPPPWWTRRRPGPRRRLPSTGPGRTSGSRTARDSRPAVAP